MTTTTIGDMPGPVNDVRAGALRRRYHERFGGAELPVPVVAIAEDLCGLAIEEVANVDVSGMLIPMERRIYLNGTESPQRRRFTLAHELGHWICQCLEGTAAPVYCRAEEVGLEPAVKVLEREANVFAAELLMPEDSVRRAWRNTWDIEGCATLLGVSGEAAHWRLFSFGLVAEPPRKISPGDKTGAA
jgi:Zn-dependent peptidase ImmA (M78 family)